MNRGACGNACPMGQMCVAGACRVDCPLPRTICGAGAAMECVDAANGCEIDTRTNATNCGGCGVLCASGQTCSSGVCMSAMTTVTFPSAASSIGVTPASTIGASSALYFRAGDLVTETFTRTSS